MASTSKYTVVHPVRFDGKLYPRGEEIKLSEKDALRLLDRGVIATGSPTVVEIVSTPSTAEALASFRKLNGMTVTDLVAYGKEAYGLDLPSDDKKETLVTAIHEAYVAQYVPANTASETV